MRVSHSHRLTENIESMFSRITACPESEVQFVAESQMKCKREQLNFRPEKSALLLQTAMSINYINLVYLISKLLFHLGHTMVSEITEWWHLRRRGNDLIDFPGKS